MKQKYKLKNGRYYLALTVAFAVSLLLHELRIPYVSVHITNFALTGLILCASLYIDLYRGTLTKLELVGTALFWAVVNIVMELFVSLQTLHMPGVDFTNFNTPDPIDAVFGLVSIGLYIWIVLRYCAQKSERVK